MWASTPKRIREEKEGMLGGDVGRLRMRRPWASKFMERAHTSQMVAYFVPRVAREFPEKKFPD